MLEFVGKNPPLNKYWSLNIRQNLWCMDSTWNDEARDCGCKACTEFMLITGIVGFYIIIKTIENLMSSTNI